VRDIGKMILAQILVTAGERAIHWLFDELESRFRPVPDEPLILPVDEPKEAEEEEEPTKARKRKKRPKKSAKGRGKSCDD
jgi:hypothetical protein